ncbi:MAG TPA: bifunctional 5,10-methylenetetrahydrofolate dehydrogenase/5,10-methenyltetrahydrofolate cyclohydrolase [Gelria sp.]|nr:bifunctional 5,10-methylenetetrahydrofolate dehydrogenase/5,10-methenyltetrahydrofolate cyclohydrolase [Gelria sp.]
MQIISGTEIAAQIRESLREANEKEGIRPVLAIIVVGYQQESLSYVRLKEKAVTSIGGETHLMVMPENSSKQSLLNSIDRLNQDKGVDGILLQLPLPDHLQKDKEEILSAISLEKDVDGFTPANRGLLSGDGAEFTSCAALACLEVIERVYPELEGKRAVLVGDSFDVIIPVATILLKRGCPVSIYPNYQEGLVNRADILVVEKGGPEIIEGAEIKGSPLIIDAGFYWEAGHSCGNVKGDSVTDNEGYLLPVPGGLGPMLIAKLCENLSQAAWRNRGNNTGIDTDNRDLKD